MARTDGIKDNNGNITSNKREVLDIWSKYFETLLNGEEIVTRYETEEQENSA